MQRSLLGEAMCRIFLSEKLKRKPHQIELFKSEKGKPFLKGNANLHFNISHSGNWVIIGLDKNEIGVDVENVRKMNYRIAQRFYSQEEYAALNALEGEAKQKFFFKLWTIKESYLKFLGKGLTKSLGSFTVFEQDGNFRIKHENSLDENIFFKIYHADPEHLLAVCSNENLFPKEITTLHIQELLKGLIYEPAKAKCGFGIIGWRRTGYGPYRSH